jgi:hypothetical protein
MISKNSNPHASLSGTNAMRNSLPINALCIRRPEQVEEKKSMTAERKRREVGNYNSKRNENVSDVRTLEINQLEKIQVATR